MKKVVKGQTIAPYSPAVIYDNKLIFVSGQITKNENSSFEEQVKEVLDSLQSVLEETGGSIETVLKTTVYLTNLDNFTSFNGIYSQYFKTDLPARAAVEVARLPMNSQVEIEAIAYKL